MKPSTILFSVLLGSGAATAFSELQGRDFKYEELSGRDLYEYSGPNLQERGRHRLAPAGAARTSLSPRPGYGSHPTFRPTFRPGRRLSRRQLKDRDFEELSARGLYDEADVDMQERGLFSKGKWKSASDLGGMAKFIPTRHGQKSQARQQKKHDKKIDKNIRKGLNHLSKAPHNRLSKKPKATDLKPNLKMHPIH